jgi:rubrerythrin
VGLAERYGPIESIILSNICWWVETNRKNGKHFYDGRFWTYGSTSAFERIFTYLTPQQIKYTLKNLRERGALLTGNYNKMRYDRTLWYTVSDEVMAVYECRVPGMRRESGVPEPGAERETDGEDAAAEAGGGMEEGTVLDGADISGQELPGAPVDRERQKYRFHSVNLHNGNGKNANSIVEIYPIHCRNLPDPLSKFNPPIPFINIYKKAAAEKPDENDKKTENVINRQAAAAENFSDEEPLRAVLAARRSDLVFDDGFYRRALGWIGKQNLEPPAAFIDWLIAECEKRKPANFRGMFYRLFFAPDLVGLFRAKGIPPPGRVDKPALALVCPACGVSHDPGLRECPACGFPKDEYGDSGKVERQKRINSMPPEVRVEYEREIAKLFFSGSVAWKDRDQWVEIDRKYHIIR